MASTLRREDWIRAGRADLDDRLRGQQDVRELSLGVITFLVHYFEAQLGAVYLSDPSGGLRLTASHAFTDRTGEFSEFKPGEGLVGQAALERRLLFFYDVSQRAPRYNYGAGEMTPAHFMAAPLVYREELEGVLLIGSAQPFPESASSFMEENLESVAIALQVAGSRLKVEELLDRTRRQAEALREQQSELQHKNKELEEQAGALRESESALQQQQEELRVINEDLAEQTKALTASESRLQQQQEELRAANEELEQRARVLEEQRNAIQGKNVALEKAQKEIREQAEAVERASRYKSEFLANMSHELRTPLNSILILSRILSENQEGNLTDKQIEFVRTVHGSGKDLLRLINEILDLAKVESGRMEISVSRVDLEELLSAMRQMFEPVAEREGLVLTVSRSADCPEAMYTDAQRLTQILRNLLANAFKFTEQGEVSLRVGRAALDRKFATEALSCSDAIAFEVADTGVGVPEDKREIIFEAFKQADGAISRKFGGTGLGLSISREFSRLLGGEIQMESEEGKGSVFTLYLPERSAHGEGDSQEAPEDYMPADAMAGMDASGPDGEAVREAGVEKRGGEPHCEQSSSLLLIVEDDPVFAGLLADLAHERGFETLLAQDGETGLHLADYHRPAGILLDVKLPGIDGFEVMQRLKKSLRTRHIPVHFISSADEPPMHALRMGAVGYLLKPVEPEDLEAAFGRIEKAIRKPVKRLLVVEDEEAQRKSILDLVASDGVAATAAASGQEALDLLAREAFDCVIMDLALHDISGFDLLDAMAEREDLHKAPVIIYTGRDLTRDEEARLTRNAKSLVVKGARSPERLLDEATLFLHQMQEKMPKQQQKMLRTSHDPEKIFQDKTVLIVDDDLRNLFALGSVLESKGMKVREAENGKEALRKLDQYDDVDIVLMDIMMPKMDGFTTMRRIRAGGAYADLPIIALTAKVMKGDKAKCIEAGANDYLSKPVETDKLLSLLRVWLHR
jgi:tubulin-specific chaperone A